LATGLTSRCDLLPIHLLKFAAVILGLQNLFFYQNQVKWICLILQISCYFITGLQTETEYMYMYILPTDTGHDIC